MPTSGPRLCWRAQADLPRRMPASYRPSSMKECLDDLKDRFAPAPDCPCHRHEILSYADIIT